MDNIELELPELPNCGVCCSEDKFLIQKDIDNGERPDAIKVLYKIDLEVTEKHIKDHHREKLIAYGIIDHAIRKKAVNMAGVLLKMIDIWVKGLENRTEFKDSDVIKAIELYTKMTGNLVDKHEVTVKRSVDDAVREFLEPQE